MGTWLEQLGAGASRSLPTPPAVVPDYPAAGPLFATSPVPRGLPEVEALPSWPEMSLLEEVHSPSR